MQLLELTINNTSPEIFYSPFRDSLSTPQLNNGWNPYYNSSGFASSPGQVGIGASSHITSMDGANCSLKWKGNGIRLFGNSTLSSYSITLDGVDATPNASSLPDQTLFDIHNLQDGDHNITLTARIPQNQIPRNSSMLVFDAAVIRTYTYGATSNSTFRYQIFDSNIISFNGRWSFEHMDSGQTIHTSNTTGDRASANFNGTAFILQGMTTMEAGNYSVTLDGITTSLSAQSSFTVPNATLFFATGLNDSMMHLVEVINNGGKLSLLENGFGTFVAFPGQSPSPPDAPPPDSPPLPGGTIASFALAGILFAVIGTAGFFYWFVWRKRKRKGGDLQLTKWDEHRYMVSNRSPGNGGSLKSSWRFGRRTRTSYDFASYGAKGDATTFESVGREAKSSRNGFSLWQREAVEGNTLGISLPVLFKHSASEVTTSEASLEMKHPYSVYDPPSHWDRLAEPKKSPSPTQEDMDLQSIALANLKNKGKARQITGASSTMEESLYETGNRLSCSPNLLQGLHVRMSNKQAWSRIKTPRGSLSLSLNPSSTPVPGQTGRNRNSDLDQISSFHAASNPSVRVWGKQISPSTTSPDSTEAPSLPSVPRSVSDSNSNTITPHRRVSSRHYLLDDHLELDETPEKEEDFDSRQPLPPPPHAYRNQGNIRDDLQRSTPNSLSLHQAVGSLSPRISGMGPDGNPYTNPDIYAETLSEEPSPLEEDRLTPVERRISTPFGGEPISVPPSGGSDLHSASPLLSTGAASNTSTDKEAEDNVAALSTQAELDRMKLSPVLPSVKRTSPFNIKFDWQSERESMTLNSKQPRRASGSSKLRVPNFDEFMQGPSRSRFRLTPSTMNHPANRLSYDPSQISTDVVTSFLDFTNSSEGSPSIRTKSLSMQSESRIFGDSSTQLAPPGLQGGRMAELKSRWSDTTASTRQRASSREGNTSSSSGDKSSRRQTYHTSTIPPSILITSSPHSKPSGQSTSNSTLFSSENPLHVHPGSDLESRTDSLPSHIAPDTLFRTTNGSDESSGTNSRRTADSSNQFHSRLLLASSRYPTLPEGTDEASTT